MSLRPDGQSLEITCHFPYSFTTHQVDISKVKFLKEDELARKLREDELFIEMRCAPVNCESKHLNLFIDGQIQDAEIFEAVANGRYVDTSHSVHP